MKTIGAGRIARNREPLLCYPSVTASVTRPVISLFRALFPSLLFARLALAVQQYKNMKT
jgi:hypothetical protein